MACTVTPLMSLQGSQRALSSLVDFPFSFKTNFTHLTKPFYNAQSSSKSQKLQGFYQSLIQSILHLCYHPLILHNALYPKLHHHTHLQSSFQPPLPTFLLILCAKICAYTSPTYVQTIRVKILAWSPLSVLSSLLLRASLFFSLLCGEAIVLFYIM